MAGCTDQGLTERWDRFAGWYKGFRAGLSVRRGCTDRLYGLYKLEAGDGCFGRSGVAGSKSGRNAKSGSGEGGGTRSKGGV